MNHIFLDGADSAPDLVSGQDDEEELSPESPLRHDGVNAHNTLDMPQIRASVLVEFQQRGCPHIHIMVQVWIRRICSIRAILAADLL